MEEGKFLISRCSEIESLLRNGCQELEIVASRNFLYQETGIHSLSFQPTFPILEY